MSIIGVGSKFTNGKEVESTEGSQAKATKALNDAKAYAFQDSSIRLFNADLNNIVTAGHYALGQDFTNLPSSSATYSSLLVYNSSGDRISQVVYSPAQAKIYTRYRAGAGAGVWTVWTESETTTGAQAKVDAHANLKTNPHGVTASQVGLGSVNNYGLATQAEAQAGTSNVKYMTPLRVKEAIASSTVTVTAGSVPVTDAGNYFTATNVEGSLQEIGQVLNGVKGSLIESVNRLINS